MNRTEKLLVEEIAPAAEAIGFRWLAAREKFVRMEPFGFVDMSWTAHSTNDDGGRLEIGPVLGVRHNQVEDAVNQLGLVYGDDNKRFTTTVTRGLSLFPLGNKEQPRLFIRISSANTDIGHVSENIISILKNDGQEFFSRYAALLACSQGLNEPIEATSHPLCNNFPLRAYYGVATAHFAEPERVPALIRSYSEFAKKVRASQFEQIRARLARLTAILGPATAG